MHPFYARYDMRKALTMDVEKKSVIPLPAPVSMLSWMMVAWMTVLILALVLQSLYMPVSISHNIADVAISTSFFRFTWTRWITRKVGEWTGQPLPQIMS